MKKLILTTFAILLTGFSPALASGELSKEQRSQMEKVIRDYLIKNPEIIRDALIELQKREMAKRTADKGKLIKENLDKLTKDKSDPVVGNAKGQVTVVEFFDYNCPYCRRIKPTVDKLLKEDNRVRYVFKELPILSQDSRLATEVALAIWNRHPEKYKDYHWGLMSLKRPVNEKIVKKQVDSMGLKWDEILKIAKSEEIKAKIDKNIALADQLGIDGTPTFIVGDQFFPGVVPYKALKGAVDKSCNGIATC